MTAKTSYRSAVTLGAGLAGKSPVVFRSQPFVGCYPMDGLRRISIFNITPFDALKISSKFEI